MKKLMCIALFSFAIMSNAMEKKEIVTNNSKEIKVEKFDYSHENKTENNYFNENITKVDMFFGCGSEGNGVYDIEMIEGRTHREAREIRRAYVRECRNYFWQFGIF